MAIDIMFIIMAAYGFYFGYAYGLIKVVIFLLSLLVALAVSMYITPSTARLIQETLQVESALLPFVAFVISLVGIMLVARIVFKLLEENINNKQLNQMTQGIGGLLMAMFFIFLFSVLVTFFSKAHVIKPDKVRENSFFYAFVEKIPDYGTAVLIQIAPYMEKFVDYMTDALDRLEKGEEEPDNPLPDDFFSDDDIVLEDTTSNRQDTLFPSDTIPVPKDSTQLDSIPEEPFDTANLPEIIIQPED
jgi:uncharacterized membrane protein required for colicin V production